jgi:hypothetical protein
MKTNIIILSSALGLMAALGIFFDKSDPQAKLSSHAQWKTYTSSKYNFSLSYPPDWNFLELPNAEDPADLDQVLFSGSSYPTPQTGARADFHLIISQDDPSVNWQSKFFDNYVLEEISLGNLPAIKISGINKESHYEEIVVITKIGEYYLQAMPNFGSDSLKYFDRMIASLQFNTQIYPSPATDTPPTSKPVKVSYDGISFSQDPSLAERVSIQTISSYTDLSGFIFNDIPEHIRFDFVNSYTSKEPFASCPPHLMPWLSHQNLGHIEMIPQIFIFPTRDFSDISQPASERIAALKELLEAEPHPSNRELPVLPLFNSTQDIQTQVRHLEFQGGSGIRFITRYAQEVIPVTNPTLFYTFQGLTKDGNYYVSAFFPVYVSSLPDGAQIGNWDTFNRQYRIYLRDTTEGLQELRTVDFDPHLTSLDAVIQSITFNHPPLDVYPPPELFTSIPAPITPYPEPKNSNSTPVRTSAKSFSQESLFEPIGFLPDNNNLLGKINTGIGILNLETKEEKSYIELPNQVIEAAISNDGRSVALALSNHNIQLSDNRHSNTMEAHTNFITALEFSPTGDKLFSASHDNWVKI